MPAAPTWNQRLTQQVEWTGWPTRLGVSAAMAGFLSIMALVSFPLPWTPVPFSLMPFALLVTGAVQRPGYAALSVLIYLAAGALGAPIFAEGASGWAHLLGPTAGYLFGFIAVSMLVSAYMARRHAPLPTALAWGLIGFVGAAILAGVGAIAWMWSSGQGLAQLDSEVTADWGVAKSTLWALLFITAASTTLSLWILARRRGERAAALNLFAVMLGSILVLHACGVTVLWLATPLSLMSAIILGSVVFLPFDIVKAGLGVALTLPFLPSPPTEENHA